MSDKLTTMDYVHKAIDALNSGHAVSATPSTMQVLASARAILKQLVYELENEAEEQEFHCPNDPG